MGKLGMKKVGEMDLGSATNIFFELGEPGTMKVGELYQ